MKNSASEMLRKKKKSMIQSDSPEKNLGSDDLSFINLQNTIYKHKHCTLTFGS